MNANPTVAPDLAERVRRAAADLGYTASSTARSLVTGRTHTVAVVVPDLGNPMFQGVLRGLTRAAAAEDYHVLVADTAEDVTTEGSRTVRARERCDALALVAPRMTTAQLTSLLPQLAPAVLINRPAPVPGVPVVRVDHRAGIRALADHLLSLGHRHLVYLAGRPGSRSDAERRAGLAQVAAQTGIRLEVLPGGVWHADGVAAADAVLASAASAALAFNDLVAQGLLAALHARGVEVPGTISVTGFDDIPLAPYTVPALTTAAVPSERIGAEAWDRLSSLLRGDPVAAEVVFPPRLRVRSSTGPPRPGAGQGDPPP